METFYVAYEIEFCSSSHGRIEEKKIISIVLQA
jgi:hypothetical protein